MPDTLLFIQHLFLAVFFSIVGIFYYCLVKARVRAQPGKFIHTGSRFTVHWWNHQTFILFRISITATALLWLLWPNTLDFLLHSYDMPRALWLVGDLMLIVGFGIAILSAAQLNGQWRSGVDQSQRTRLVMSGVYAISRNPCFIGVHLAQIGYFLAWPSTFSGICLVIGLLSIHIQSRLEERHLTKLHNEQYIEYCKKVPRWLL